METQYYQDIFGEIWAMDIYGDDYVRLHPTDSSNSKSKLDIIVRSPNAALAHIAKRYSELVPYYGKVVEL